MEGLKDKEGLKDNTIQEDTSIGSASASPRPSSKRRSFSKSPTPPYRAESGLGTHSDLEDDARVDFSPIIVAVCAMEAKTAAQPMQNILQRLQVPYIKIVLFNDRVILEDPIEEWPICHCFIAFFSKGFPLAKAIDYVKLRKPLVINDLEMQYSLMDRCEVYKILSANGVETPRHAVCYRGNEHSADENTDGGAEIHELDDLLEVNGHCFHKPFVEKPVSAEDHNIYIYFPSDYGGGSQRLFRKVKNRSSQYSKESSVRTKGSYIYEEFLATDGTDVKVYTVGPDYAHAEARKSPALDGKVERDELGKEVRHPVILTAKEKLIARAVCLAFKQTVCGFDLLRANGHSYVCDVNGFSFVKNSQKYYDDCAQILLEMITAHLCPQFFPSIPPSVEYLMDEIPDMPVPIPRAGNNLELRCVVGVIRHGDRTPKQKMKMIVKHKRFFDLFKELNGYDTGQLKIKKPKLLQRVLDIARQLLAENGEEKGGEIQEKIHKLEQLRTVLEMYGTFTGINRKVQFKLLSKKDHDGAPQMLLILKWGGEQTQFGQQQAEELGRAFRIIYPGGEGEYASLPGSGFLRLHSTYRHDLKVYASDEGRVQMTAAAFTKGLLDLESNPASVLVHLVKRDQAATNMLDTSTDAQDAMNSVKERLHMLMRSSKDFTEQSFKDLAPTEAEPIVAAMKQVGNPRAMCERVYQRIQALLKEIKTYAEKESNLCLYHEETLQLMVNRWGKLEKDFKLKTGQFDISKIPDIYDCIKYDLLHNTNHIDLAVGKDLFQCIMPLADIVMPQEYGITKAEKLDIAHKICSPLLRKIQADFHHTIVNEQADVIHRLDHRLSKGVVSPKRHVRTRLYFTSESHIHSLTNLLKFEDIFQPPEGEQKEEALKIHKFPELNYITQIVFILFEDLTQPEKSDLRFRVHIHFSPGVRCRDELLAPNETKSNPELLGNPAQLQVVTRQPHMTIGESGGGGSQPANMYQTLKPDTTTSTSTATTTTKHNSSMPCLLLADNASLPGDSPRPPHREMVVKRKLDLSSHSLLVTPDGRVKSFSETEVLASKTQQITPTHSMSSEAVCICVSPQDDLNLYLSKYKGSPRKSLPDVLAKGVVKPKRKISCPAKHHDSTLQPLVTFKIGEEPEDTSEGGENFVPSAKKHGRQDLPPSILEERGLVLATELSSAIYPLSEIGSVTLRHMNQYLTSVTGIHLNYDKVTPQEPSPGLRVRTPTRYGSIPRDSSFHSAQQEREWELRSGEDLKDSIESMEDHLERTQIKSHHPAKFPHRPYALGRDRGTTSRFSYISDPGAAGDQFSDKGSLELNSRTTSEEYAAISKIAMPLKASSQSSSPSRSPLH